MLNGEIYTDEMISDKHAIKAVGGLESIIYTITQKCIIFKIDAKDYPYFIKFFKINDFKCASLWELSFQINDESNYIGIYVDEDHLNEWNKYTFFLVSEYLPDFYYCYKEARGSY